MCLRKLFASMYIWVFSMAPKMPPFVALTAPPPANSRSLVYSKLVRRPSEDLATSCPCAWGGQSHTRYNDAVRQTPLLPFTFPTASSSFLFLLCPRPYLIPIPKIKRSLLPFSMAREKLSRRTKLLQGLSLQIWNSLGFIRVFLLVPPQSRSYSFQAISYITGWNLDSLSPRQILQSHRVHTEYHSTSKLGLFKVLLIEVTAHS